MKSLSGELISRRFALGASATLALGGTAAGLVPTAAGAAASEPPLVYGPLPRPERSDAPLSIGSLVFPKMDQIDFTGPFEVFARIPDATVQVIAKTTDPVHDVKGLAVTPTLSISQAPLFDILHVAGGWGSRH